MILTGALVNGGAIVVGGLLGTFGGKLMPEKMRQTVLGATALVSMGIGISGAIGSSNQLIPILSLVWYRVPWIWTGNCRRSCKICRSSGLERSDKRISSNTDVSRYAYHP